MSHHECRHCPIGAGVTYCLRTTCVYIQPEEVPTPHGRKKRGDACDVFSAKVRSLSKTLRGVKVLAYIMLSKGLVIPVGVNDFDNVIDLLRHLDSERLKSGDIR